MSELWPDIHRPAGQSEAWYRGFDWANGDGPYEGLDANEAAEEWGYDFGTPESEQFDQGAQYALDRQGESLFGDWSPHDD